MEISISRRIIAPLVLRLMADAQQCGRRLDLDALVAALDLPRADVRRTLSDLHAEGLVDVFRMRLTLAGFTLGLTQCGNNQAISWSASGDALRRSDDALPASPRARTRVRHGRGLRRRVA